MHTIFCFSSLSQSSISLLHVKTFEKPYQSHCQMKKKEMISASVITSIILTKHLGNLVQSGLASCVFPSSKPMTIYGDFLKDGDETKTLIFGKIIHENSSDFFIQKVGFANVTVGEKFSPRPVVWLPPKKLSPITGCPRKATDTTAGTTAKYRI